MHGSTLCSASGGSDDDDDDDSVAVHRDIANAIILRLGAHLEG
jgi:hypothetical protein